MRAIVVRELGGPEGQRLETVPRPEPEATEMLVRVTAAGVNPVEWKTVRAGRRLRADAEYATARARQLAKTWASITDVEAAALPLPG